jgi:Leucine-rich repeat (LRR) protein
MVSLLDFKRAITGDPNRVLSSWNARTHFCKWNGVTCSFEHSGRVISLDLGSHGLSGSISPSLGNLTLLRELNLSSNTLSGQLPPLGRLHKLEVLDLGNSSLHDKIPGSLNNFTNLRILDLGYNLIFGEIPPQVSLLSNLLVLRLSFERPLRNHPLRAGQIVDPSVTSLIYKQSL